MKYTEEQIRRGTQEEMQHAKTFEKLRANPGMSNEDAARAIAIEHLELNPEAYKERSFEHGGNLKSELMLKVGDNTNVGKIQEVYGDQYKIDNKWYHKSIVEKSTLVEKIKQGKDYYNGIKIPDKVNPNTIISAFSNQMDWNKVEKYTEIMKEEMLQNDFPPILGYPGYIDEAHVGTEFLNGTEITKKDIGKQVWYVTDGHHRAISAINAKLPYIKTKLDYSAIVSENNLYDNGGNMQTSKPTLLVISSAAPISSILQVLTGKPYTSDFVGSKLPGQVLTYPATGETFTILTVEEFNKLAAKPNIYYNIPSEGSVYDFLEKVKNEGEHAAVAYYKRNNLLTNYTIAGLLQQYATTLLGPSEIYKELVERAKKSYRALKKHASNLNEDKNMNNTTNFGFEPSPYGGVVKEVKNPDGTFRRSRVVEFKGKVKAHRVFQFKTQLGHNSAGYEVPYKSIEEALADENKWLHEETMHNGGQIELVFKKVDEDTGNLIYKGSDDNIYIDVEGTIHNVTDEREPLAPVRNVYVKQGEPVYNPEDRFGRNPGSKRQTIIGNKNNITIEDIVEGAKFKINDGTVFIINEIKEYPEIGKMVRANMEGGIWKYSDGINEFVAFLNEEKAEKIMADGGPIKKSDFTLGEVQRLIELAENGNQEQAIKELKEYVDLYTDAKAGGTTQKFGKNIDDIINEYFNAVVYIRQNIGKIPNNYEGKTPEQVWQAWNEDQRWHFLKDHVDDLDTKYSSTEGFKEFLELRKQWVKMGYCDVPQDVRLALEVHVAYGQYKNGGTLKRGELIIDDKKQKIYEVMHIASRTRKSTGEKAGVIELLKYPNFAGKGEVYLVDSPFTLNGKEYFRKYESAKALFDKYILISKQKGFDVIEELKNGGAIINQYKGRSAESVWQAWNEDQRQHFLADHWQYFNKKTQKENHANIAKLSFGKLSKDVVEQLEFHIKDGEYGNGGNLQTIKAQIEKEIALHNADDTYENDDAENQIFEDLKVNYGWDLYDHPSAEKYMLKGTAPERLQYLLDYVIPKLEVPDAITITADELAVKFSEILKRDIGITDLKKVISTNKDRNDASCATHDYIDANMAMAEAFKDLTGREFNLQSDTQTALWNKAWDIAKKNEFYLISKPSKRIRVNGGNIDEPETKGMEGSYNKRKHGLRFRKVCPVGTQIQHLVFNKAQYTQEQAKQWALTHKFKWVDKFVEEKENTMHVRQQPKSKFKKDGWATISLTNGVKAVIACPK